MNKHLAASVRACLLNVAKARRKTQIDICFGDALTPGPVHATYPVLTEDLPAPRLRNQRKGENIALSWPQTLQFNRVT